jgi:hypothetical protein
VDAVKLGAEALRELDRLVDSGLAVRGAVQGDEDILVHVNLRNGRACVKE